MKNRRFLVFGVLYILIMNILPLLKRLIAADPKHFGWSVMTSHDRISGSAIKKDIFFISFAESARVFEISKDGFEVYLHDLNESDLIYGVIRAFSENGMRVLFWEEKVLQEVIHFVRIWKPNNTSQNVKEIKGNDFFVTLCLAYLSNYE